MLSVFVTLDALEYYYHWISKFVHACPLPPDVVGKLKNAKAIRIWEITLDATQRLFLQCFLVDTEEVTYSGPL
jgi:hypothetical protein